MTATGYYYVSYCLTLLILTLSNSIKTCRGLSYLVWAWLGGIDGLCNAKLTLGWRRTFQDICATEGETLGFQAAQLMDLPGGPPGHHRQWTADPHQLYPYCPWRQTRTFTSSLSQGLTSSAVG